MTIDIHSAVTFIKEYRIIEKADAAMGQELMEYVLPGHPQKDHLGDSWLIKKNDWGRFYLNLSHAMQYEFLKFWGLQSFEGDNYAADVKLNPMKMLFAPLPPVIYWPHQLLVFFNNHGISEMPAKGVKLSNLPPDEQCFGNSANWGDYILSLSTAEQERVLNEIAAYIGFEIPG